MSESVPGAAESSSDQGGNTQQFRAFMQGADPVPARSLPVPLIAAVAVGLVVVVALVVWLLVA